MAFVEQLSPSTEDIPNRALPPSVFLGPNGGFSRASGDGSAWEKVRQRLEQEAGSRCVDKRPVVCRCKAVRTGCGRL